jgi:aspartate aminotransferase
MLVAQSFSKNAGLYGERLGALHIRCTDAVTATRIVQQLKYIARREISSPGRYPAEIVSKTL